VAKKARASGKISALASSPSELAATTTSESLSNSGCFDSSSSSRLTSTSNGRDGSIGRGPIAIGQLRASIAMYTTRHD